MEQAEPAGRGPRNLLAFYVPAGNLLGSGREKASAQARRLLPVSAARRHVMPSWLAKYPATPVANVDFPTPLLRLEITTTAMSMSSISEHGGCSVTC